MGAEPTNEKAVKNIEFQWAFCALRKTDVGKGLEVITRDTALKSGDQIKFFLKLESRCFFYLIYQSSQHELSVLYPYRFTHFDSKDASAGEHYIPESNQWFELDEHTGQEKFYVLASTKRLFDLESLVNQYESADKAKKSGFGDKIIVEIRKLRKRHLKFKTYAEKPVTIIGNLRGADQTKTDAAKDIANYAVKISTTTFFSRTYTIDHQ
jgi:hypothetical protein